VNRRALCAQAADQGHVEAWFHLGVLHLRGWGAPASATQALYFFSLAAKMGHLLAQYNLAMMHLSGAAAEKRAPRPPRPPARPPARPRLRPLLLEGWHATQLRPGLQCLGRPRPPACVIAVQRPRHAEGGLPVADPGQGRGRVIRPALWVRLLWAGPAAPRRARPGPAPARRAGCTAALELLKRVAERGPWAAVLQDAAAAWAAGDAAGALLAYLRGAEAGLELAQANAAWLLGRGLGAGPGPAAQALALRLHQRAAGQGNVEALLQLGDSHWYGRGVRRDWGRAAQLYAAAAKFQDAQALFNLGLMHEFGAGLPRDLHLAKRHYDRALEARPDARVPVQLALASLALHGWWDRARPYLPARLDWLWARVYAIPDPGATLQAVTQGELAGARDNIGLGLGLLERLLDTGLVGARGGGGSGGGAGERALGGERGAGGPPGERPAGGRAWLGNTGESLLLLALCAGLWLVLWRRRSLRAAQPAGLRGLHAERPPATAAAAAGAAAQQAAAAAVPAAPAPAAPAAAPAAAVHVAAAVAPAPDGARPAGGEAVAVGGEAVGSAAVADGAATAEPAGVGAAVRAEAAPGAAPQDGVVEPRQQADEAALGGGDS